MNRGVRTLNALTAIEFPRRFLNKWSGMTSMAFISCVPSSDSQKVSAAFHNSHPLRVASMHIQCRTERFSVCRWNVSTKRICVSLVSIEISLSGKQQWVNAHVRTLWVVSVGNHNHFHRYQLQYTKSFSTRWWNRIMLTHKMLAHQQICVPRYSVYNVHKAHAHRHHKIGISLNGGKRHEHSLTFDRRRIRSGCFVYVNRIYCWVHAYNDSPD